MPTAPPQLTTVGRDHVAALCRAALVVSGACGRVADLLTAAALFAEDSGVPTLGLAHLIDYLDALDDGRLDGQAVPRLSRPARAVITSDAGGGAAHAGFDAAVGDVVDAARRFGVAVFAQHNSYTCGQLAWFTERLAGSGLVALATATSPALLAAGPGGGRVFGTNPMSFSVPRAHRPPLTVDQASSSTAYVTVRERAARGEPLPEGWALDAQGEPTTDAHAALAGALLPFGGYKGANVALLVELLSSMAGGQWSVDAPPFDSGSRSPSVGMFVLAVDHRAVGPDYAARVEEHADRLAEHGVGRRDRSAGTLMQERLEVEPEVLTALRRRRDRGAARSAPEGGS